MVVYADDYDMGKSIIFRSALDFFEVAYQFASSNPEFLKEIHWQQGTDIEAVTPQIFMRELSWVILNTGMREKVVRKHFENVNSSFFDWYDLNIVLYHKDWCIQKALSYFNNRKKMMSILESAKFLRVIGIDFIKESLKRSDVDILQHFPFVGPITSRHLAKNLGAPVAKDDRHLKRISAYFGYQDAQHLCVDISNKTNVKVAIVDLVLWRYGSSSFNTNSLINKKC